MNQELIFLLLQQSAFRLLGGAMLAYFIVFAFLRDRVQRPRLSHWAFWIYGSAMLLPVASMLMISLGESPAVIGSIVFSLAPVALLSGVLLLIWSCVPLPEHAPPPQMRFAETKQAKEKNG